MKVKKDSKDVNKSTNQGKHMGRQTVYPKGKAVPVKQIKIEDSPFEIFIKRNALLVFTLTELLLIFIVFHKFLLFTDVYFFKDSGSDSVNSGWTRLVHLSNYLRNTGFPKWSFNEGVGKDIYPFSIGEPFNLALALFPKNIIPYAVIFMEAIKIYLGGLFFYLFLRSVKLSAFTSVVGGLLYSFSGFMIIGGSLNIFSTEAVFASLVLFSCEKFLSEGKWYLLPIPFFFFASYQPFLLYLYGLLITIYSIVRILVNDGWQWRKMILTVFKQGILAFFGVAISSFIFLSNLDLLAHTPRSFGGQASAFKAMISAPIFGTSLILEITTSLYRFFSNDLLGTGDNFKGWVHYIEAPTLYTGLLTCLLMPQAFFLKSYPKRKSIIYLVLTLLAIIPLFFPFFRHLLWLFSGDYYRTYSLFLSMLFLTLCLKTLSALDSRLKINPLALFITLGVLLLLLYYPFYGTGLNLLNNTLRSIAAFFLIVYACLIYLSSSNLKLGTKGILFRNFTIPLLGITILIELSYFSSVTVNDRKPVTVAELHTKTGYNDYTDEAISFINSNDASFFRVDKVYSSGPSKNDGGYNDGLIQNYRGTSSYDSFNQLYYCTFLNDLNVWSKEGSNFRKIAPCLTRPLLLVLLNEKYLLIRQPYTKVPFLYDSITTTGNVTISRNRLYLPLGYTYRNYISFSEFKKLNDFQKDKMLFRAFVADSSELAAFKDLNQLYAKDTIPGTDINLKELANYTSALRKDSLSNLFFNQNTVKGTIKLSQPKLLFFSIPYDKGWQFNVDGTIVKPLLTNIGFMGILLARGQHSVELNYEPPLLKLGCYISGLGILGYILLFIRYRKNRF